MAKFMSPVSRGKNMVNCLSGSCKIMKSRSMWPKGVLLECNAGLQKKGSCDIKTAPSKSLPQTSVTTLQFLYLIF